MKAFGVREYKAMGDLSALEEIELPKPSAAGHDLLVRVKAVATNPIDYKRLANMGKPGEAVGDKPLVVGWDAAGVVEQVGEETSLFRVGDEVMFAGDFFRAGAFAEYVVVDERIVGPKPSSLTWSQAATVSLTTLTAWEALIDQLKIPVSPEANAGKTILITGGAGGVSTIAVEIAKKVLGLRVIATGSRSETIDYVKKLGADSVINHREPLTAQLEGIGIKELDYVFHCVDMTPELFTEFTALVKPFGGIVNVWPAVTVDLMQLFWKSLNFSTVMMFARPALKSEASKRQHDILEQAAKLLDEGVLQARERESFPLDANNLRKALEMQASGKAMGKISLYF